MVRLLDIRLPMTTYISLVVVDMTISYFGVTCFGMVEGSWLINYYGTELGVVLVFFLSLVIAITLWRLRDIRIFSKAAILALWMLSFIELAAVINNLVLMS